MNLKVTYEPVDKPAPDKKRPFVVTNNKTKARVRLDLFEFNQMLESAKQAHMNWEYHQTTGELR